ncbi:MAG: TPM domain-containing protein [Clostridiales bacterium]|nr:TPM domain-containing protein [Clostridiales bacterium]
MHVIKRMAASLAVVTLLLIPLWAGAQSAGQTVFDQAGLFTVEECQRLETRIESLNADMDWNVYIATTSDAGGKTARDYADDFYDYGGLGRGPDYSGLLLLIDMDNREAYITTAGQAIACYTDSRIDSMLDSVTGYLKNGRYEKAAEAFLTKTGSYAASPPSQTGAAADDRIELSPVQIVLIAVSGGLLAAGGTFLGVYLKYGAKGKQSSYPFRQQSNMQMLRSEDRLVNKTLRTRHIPQDNNHHTGGGSSTHVSSSGRTHGGGGRGF